MDEGKFAADFLAKNISNIYSIGKTCFGKLDNKVKLNLESTYSNYLKETGNKLLQSKSFFIRDKSVDLYSYYVPVGISCNQQNIHSAMLIV
jgi:hypothetical protein